MSATAAPLSRLLAAQTARLRLPAASARLAGRPWLPWVAGLLATLVATAPTWVPWLDPRLNLWEIDDAKNHLIRLYHFTWLLERGQWLPRWVPDMYMGYGYPLFNFYAPGTYYLGWLLGRLLRLDVWDAYRAVGVIAALAAAGGIYALAVAVWRRVALGVLAALVLLYGPYTIQINLFKRGDLPEALALALVPWLLLCLWGLWEAPTRPRAVRWTVATTAVGAAIVLTHNLTAFAGAALGAVWVLYLCAARPGWRPLARTARAAVLIGGLTAFFWLPAVGEGRLVHLEELWGTGGLDYKGWFIEPNGQSPRQKSPDNRQTRTGLIDLNLHYPHQLVAPLKLSWSQAGLGVLALGSSAAGLGAALRRRVGNRRATLAPGAGGDRPGGPPVERVVPGPLGGRPPDGSTGDFLARESPAARQPAALPLAVLPFLAVALACWYLTFAQSNWAWERLPGLPLFQFPWRLFGPLGICLALAAAGALAGPLAALERRWGEPGRRAGLALVAGVAAVTLFNHLGDRELHFLAGPDLPARTIDGRTVLQDEIHDVPGVGTTSNREYMPREVSIATYTVGSPRGRNVYEKTYPEAEWLGGLLTPLSGDLRFLGWQATPGRIGFRVANDGRAPAAVGIRQLLFPGWRAWIDGHPVGIGVAPYVPEQQAWLGFMVVDVPPGEHTVDVVFGPTRLRAAAILASLATWLVASGALLWLLTRRRGWSPRQVWGAWALLALLPAYATWRGLAPAVGPLAARPVPPARFAAGVWRAPDLPRHAANLLVNVAEAVATGRAWNEGPSGGVVGPASHVDVRQLTVSDIDPDRGAPGTTRRQWLFLHPPSSVTLDVALPAGRTVWFQASLALDPATWEQPVGAEVRYLVHVAPLDRQGLPGTPVTVADLTLSPRARTEDRRWVPLEADLSRWAGGVVRLTLETQSGPDLNYAWSGWGNPLVVVRESDRVRPLAGQPAP